MLQLFNGGQSIHNSSDMRLHLFLILFLFVAFISCSHPADKHAATVVYPQDDWEWFEDSEAEGWSTEELEAVGEAIDTVDTASLIIVHKGKVVKSWGDLDTKYRCHSIRKSFLSALYGVQVDEGAININATMTDLEIDDNDPLSETEKQATVRMLLKARSGIYHPALYETAAMAARRPDRHSHAPDIYWYYNNWDFNVLGTIYEQETGENIHQSFYERIAQPIGMQDYVPEDGVDYSGEASRHNAYPFEMSTRDMARFGLLYLNDGNWEGHQIIPASWVKESTTSYSDAGASGGYGYLWWISVDGQHFSGVEDVPEGTYTARGYRGHVLAVIPKYDLVVVHRVDTFVPGTRVPYSDFGKILMLILDALDKS